MADALHRHGGLLLGLAGVGMTLAGFAIADRNAGGLLFVVAGLFLLVVGAVLGMSKRSVGP